MSGCDTPHHHRFVSLTCNDRVRKQERAMRCVLHRGHAIHVTYLLGPERVTPLMSHDHASMITTDDTRSPCIGIVSHIRSSIATHLCNDIWARTKTCGVMIRVY